MSIKKQFIGMATLLLAGAILNAGLILYRVNQMQDDARVVNFAGFVRGATQRLVKRELADQPSAEMASRIDEVATGLIDGSSALELPRASGEFRSKMEAVIRSWGELKEDIKAYRQDPTTDADLFDKSESFFIQCDEAVGVAEDMASSKVTTTQFLQIVLTVVNVMVLVAIAFTARGMAGTLHETIQNLATTSTQITSTVELQDRIATERAVSTNETTTAVEQLGESSHLSAQQAANTASEALQSLSLAKEGTATVQKTLGAMDDMKENVDGLAHEILSLSERVDQIADISTFVGDLANQTNMLALNAAVEAAHAGEHGKGFAVVATEIRKLADQSSKSVSRINDLVADIQQATNAAVMATEQGTKVVDVGMNSAQQIAQVFDQLAASINRASESVQQISLNTKEQSSGISQVVEAIESLNSSAKETAHGLKQTNESVHILDHAVNGLQKIVGISNAHPR